MPYQPLHTRGLTSLFTLFGFAIMSLTGLVLYVVPAGRVAYWTNWTLIGLSRDSWANIHILSSLLFVAAGVVHTVLNWKPLLKYFTDRISERLKLRRELAITTAVSILIIISSLWPIPPLTYMLDLNEWAKETWVVAETDEPPFGHAELLSLKVFAQRMQIDLPGAEQELKLHNIRYSGSSETLETIARNNNIAPSELYQMIRKYEAVPTEEQANAYTPESIEAEFTGTGIGNKTVAMLCQQTGVPLTTALTRLHSQGISALESETLKYVGERHGFAPIELLKVMLLEQYQPQPGVTH